MTARRERRPVVLGIPFDLQDRPWDGPDKLPVPSTELLPRLAPIPPHPDDVANAAKLVASAERVVVFAGLGAVQAKAGPACRALAAKVGGLLATTLPARGLFHEDPYCVGIAGSFTPEVGLEYLKEADLVIAVGGSLGIQPYQAVLGQLEELEKKKADVILESAKSVFTEAGLGARVHATHKTGLLVDCLTDYDQSTDLIMLGKRGE